MSVCQIRIIFGRLYKDSKTCILLTGIVTIKMYQTFIYIKSNVHNTTKNIVL